MAPAFIITFDDTTNNPLHTQQHQQIKSKRWTAFFSTMEQNSRHQISYQILQVRIQETSKTRSHHLCANCRASHSSFARLYPSKTRAIACRRKDTRNSHYST